MFNSLKFYFLISSVFGFFLFFSFFFHCSLASTSAASLLFLTFSNDSSTLFCISTDLRPVPRLYFLAQLPFFLQQDRRFTPTSCFRFARIRCVSTVLHFTPGPLVRPYSFYLLSSKQGIPAICFRALVTASTKVLKICYRLLVLYQAGMIGRFREF